MSRATAVLLLLAIVLTGCASVETVVGDSVWITPNKYQFFDCKQLLATEAAQKKHAKDLEELMAKAAQSPGGAVIGTLAYRTSYQQTLGEQRVVATTIGEKRCRTERESVSAQSVF